MAVLGCASPFPGRLKPDPRSLEEDGRWKMDDEGRMPARSQGRSARRASEMGVAELACVMRGRPTRRPAAPFADALPFPSGRAEPFAFGTLRRAQVMSPEKQSSSSQEPL